jgi:tetratricopeptide (TPR) repeat protein
MNRDGLLEEANEYYRRGALAEARETCERILQAHRADAGALTLMAAIAADERNGVDGRRLAGLAAAADPAAPGPHYVLGRLCQDEGRFAEAEAHYRRSLELKGDQPKAHNNLGAVLHMQGKLDQAVASYRRALELDPTLPQANQNLASITRDAAAAEVAIAGFRRMLQANPRDAQTHTDLANVYRELGRHREAIASFTAALACDPQLPEAHFARSMELLLCGEYREGFEEFEWRWRVRALNLPRRDFSQPPWDGASLPGKTILLHAEQGFGDTLNFVRYAPLVAERCGGVLLECQPSLQRLLAGTPGLSAVHAQGERLPSFDAHLPMMSLPHVFGTTLERVPWSGAYVRAPADAVAAARRHIASPGPNIGLVWAGEARQGDDRKRSTTLAMLSPLAGAAGATFYGLQKGAGAAQASSPPTGMRLVDLGAHIRDFADTAAFIACLDLVISVDTSVAHLAGAMAAPVWVLVSFSPDWRYHLEREDSPWYPTMRLFRQTSDGDWSGAIVRLAQALRTTSKPFR